MGSSPLKILTTSEYLLMLCNGQHSVPKENKSANKPNMKLVRALNALLQRLSLEAS